MKKIERILIMETAVDWAILIKWISSRVDKNIAKSLLISIVMIGISAALFSFSEGSVSNGEGFWVIFGRLKDWQATLCVAVFFVLFFVLLLLFQTLHSSEAEDVYSYLREKLEGNWEVWYEVRDGKKDLLGQRLVHLINCEAEVNKEDKKLIFAFNIRNNPIYMNGMQVIRFISLRPDGNGRYCLIYHYDGDRSLKPEIASVVHSESGAPLAKINIEIVGILYFDLPTSSSRIDEMNGHWFDLNGNIISLFSVVSEIQYQKELGNNITKRMSEAKIGPDNFSAHMGKISFKRVGRRIEAKSDSDMD